MSDFKITPTETKILVSPTEDHLTVALVRETIHFPTVQTGIHFSIKEERFDFSSPLSLNLQGWPFGPNPMRSEGLRKDETKVVDIVTMPSFYRVVKWLFLISDDHNGLEVTSEIKCLRKGEDVLFMEYAMMGDTGTLLYDLDVVAEEDKVKLSITSRYNGIASVRTVKIGIFN
ncbi:MAG: hypothetical protein H7832_11155 [Magnetococcus sp. DMHC-6]